MVAMDFRRQLITLSIGVVELDRGSRKAFLISNGTPLVYKA